MESKRIVMETEKIVFQDRSFVIDRMNQWGAAHIPFFFMIDYSGERGLVLRPEEISTEQLRYVIGNYSNIAACPQQVSVGNKAFSWQIHPVSYEAYSRSFQHVSDEIHAGNSFLVNLTAPTQVQTDLTLEDIFWRAKAPYRLWLRDQFVVFSPETFVQIRKGRIHSFPMKGTMDATLPHARQLLASDPKEKAEHATITDLIRNDLSRVASQVTVARYAYIDEIITHHGPLLQMSSDICGVLPDDYLSRLGSLFFELLPAGSITGAPKKKTVEIIREAEGYDRGFYTGVAGFFDGQDLDSAVLIRFMEQQSDGSMVYKSGGGVTFQSHVRQEYEELIQKVYVPVS